MFSGEFVTVCSCIGSRLGTDEVMWGLIQTGSLSVKKEGMEQLAQRRKWTERRRNGGNCDFDTLNSGRH